MDNQWSQQLYPVNAVQPYHLKYKAEISQRQEIQGLQQTSLKSNFSFPHLPTHNWHHLPSLLLENQQ